MKNLTLFFIFNGTLTGNIEAITMPKPEIRFTVSVFLRHFLYFQTAKKNTGRLKISDGLYQKGISINFEQF